MSINLIMTVCGCARRLYVRRISLNETRRGTVVSQKSKSYYTRYMIVYACHNTRSGQLNVVVSGGQNDRSGALIIKQLIQTHSFCLWNIYFTMTNIFRD